MHSQLQRSWSIPVLPLQSRAARIRSRKRAALTQVRPDCSHKDRDPCDGLVPATVVSTTANFPPLAYPYISHNIAVIAVTSSNMRKFAGLVLFLSGCQSRRHRILYVISLFVDFQLTCCF